MVTSSIDSARIQRPRPYQSSLFVNREREIQIIASKIQAARKNITTGSVVNFWGVQGIGKTWILSELHHRYAYRSEHTATPFAPARPSFALFYSFPNEPISVATIVCALAREALSQLSVALSAQEQADLMRGLAAQDIETLVNILAALSRRFIALILLDNTEETLPATWEQLELQLIEPLITVGHALVVIAGRRQVPRWRRFEVRRRVAASDESYIQPFDKPSIARQLEQSQYNIPADLVLPYSGGGNPHLVDAIAYHFATWAKNAESAIFDQDWLQRHRDALVELLRESEAQLLSKLPIELSRVLDVVAPLRFYRLEALRFMLEQAQHQPEQADLYYVNLLRDLEQTDIVWWDRTRRAYITSPVVRHLIGQRQLLQDREDFAAKHRRAWDMYWGWVHDLPAASEDFIGEILFHLASIYQADHDLDALRAKSHETLLFAKKALRPDRLLVIRKQFDQHTGDQEFLELLPEAIYTELLRDLD